MAILVWLTIGKLATIVCTLLEYHNKNHDTHLAYVLSLKQGLSKMNVLKC